MKKLLILFLSIFLISLVSSANPTVYYKFNQASGDAIDYMGLYNLTNSGVTYNTGKLGNASIYSSSGVLYNTSTSSLTLGTSNFTILFWMKDNQVGSRTGYATSESSWLNIGNWRIASHETLDNGKIGFYATSDALHSTTTVQNNSWHRIVVVREGTGAGQTKLYIDGVLEDTGLVSDNFNKGSIYLGDDGFASVVASQNLDDFRIYKGYAWNQTEILEDYNSGIGNEFSFNNEINVLLSYPTTGTTFSVSEVNLTATYSTDGYNFTNATYYVWDSDNNLFNQTKVIVTGNNTNSTNITIYDLTIGNYKWNVELCGKNLTGTNCVFAESNNTFSIGALILNQTYNNYTYETSNENFLVTVSLLPGSELSLVKLVYNGTEYSVSDINNNGNYTTLSKNINIPLNPNNYSNVTREFYWKFTYNGGQTQTLTINNQTVGFINLQNCNATYSVKTLNFTFYDEINQTYVNAAANPTTLLLNFNYWLGDGTIKKKYNFQSLGSSSNSFQFCIFPNRTNYIDMDMQYYSAINYAERSYYFRNKTINNTMQDILLYSIPSSEATKFSTNVKQGTDAFSNALVEVSKYFVGLGQYKTIMIGLTDDKGSFVANLDLDQNYNFTIIKDGVNYGSYIKQASCASAPCEIDINLDETLLNPFDPFYDYYAQYIDYDYTVDYNSSMIYINFTDTTGTAQYWRLWVYQSSTSNETLIDICDTKSYASIGSLSCNYTGYYGDINAKVYISRSPEKLVDFINFVNDNSASVFGTSGLLAAVIIFIIIILSGVRNPVNALVLMPFAVVILKFIGFLPISWTWIVAFVVFIFWIISRVKT